VACIPFHCNTAHMLQGTGMTITVYDRKNILSVIIILGVLETWRPLFLHICIVSLRLWRYPRAVCMGVSSHVFWSWRHVVGAGSRHVKASCLPLRDLEILASGNGASFTRIVWAAIYSYCS
jgi:hypothetical protein